MELAIDRTSINWSTVRKNTQTGLLVTTTIASVISLIPSLRFVGSVACRSVALLSTTINCTDKDAQESKLARLISIVKVVAVAAGLVALVNATPTLMVKTLTLDTALNVFAGIRAGYQERVIQAVVHLGASVINVFLIKAFLVASWELMAVAAIVSAVFMFCIATSIGCRNETNFSIRQGIDTFCYSVLGFVQLVGAGLFLEYRSHHRTTSHFRLANETSDKMNTFDRHGKLVKTVMPGETKEFELPFQDTFLHQKIYNGISRPGEKIILHTGSYVDLVRDNTAPAKLDAYQIDIETRIEHAPLAFADFPTAPVGGLVIAGPDVTNHKSLCDGDYRGRYDLPPFNLVERKQE
ncbi:MAG: hypothetical protein H0X51_07540 [Parachlamydiaceae bacterium]|nr:hypothetical protein [Parachlamydiaceae bacterium]